MDWVSNDFKERSGPHRHTLMTMVAYAFFHQNGREKTASNESTPQPALLAVHQAILEQIIGPLSQRSPECRRLICGEHRRESPCRSNANSKKHIATFVRDGTWLLGDGLERHSAEGRNVVDGQPCDTPDRRGYQRECGAFEQERPNFRMFGAESRDAGGDIGFNIGNVG